MIKVAIESAHCNCQKNVYGVGWIDNVLELLLRRYYFVVWCNMCNICECLCERVCAGEYVANGSMGSTFSQVCSNKCKCKGLVGGVVIVTRGKQDVKLGSNKTKHQKLVNRSKILRNMCSPYFCCFYAHILWIVDVATKGFCNTFRA